MKRDHSGTRKNNNREQENSTPGRRSSLDNKELVSAAHEQAEKDMLDDPELTASSPNDDLDEGESARLGEEKTDMI